MTWLNHCNKSSNVNSWTSYICEKGCLYCCCCYILSPVGRSRTHCQAPFVLTSCQLGGNSLASSNGAWKKTSPVLLFFHLPSFLPIPGPLFTNISLHSYSWRSSLLFPLLLGHLISGHPHFSLPLTLFAPALWKYLPSLKCSTASESAWALSPGIILPDWFPLLTRGMALGSILCPLKYLDCDLLRPEALGTQSALNCT